MTNSPTRFEPDVGFVTGSPEMYVNTAGSYIKFEDYEQLKQQLDAVVAECAELISALRCVYTTAFTPVQPSHGDIRYVWDYVKEPKEEIEQWIAEAKTTSVALAKAEVRGVERALAVVSACRENICPGGLSENRQYEESIVQPHLDGIADELENLIVDLREGRV